MNVGRAFRPSVLLPAPAAPGPHTAREPSATHALRAVFVAVLAIAPTGVGQLAEHYVYRPQNTVGSDAQFSPLSAFMNGAFDYRHFVKGGLLDQHYATGFSNVGRLLWESPWIIGDYNQRDGHNFWAEEVFPTRLGRGSSPWVPNYQSHLVGEGLVCRQLAEWYDANGYRSPYLLAVLTTFSFQFMNEVNENGSYTGNSVDPIADILIFNPLGWLLFYFDDVAEFFARDLHFSNWGGQALLNPTTLDVINAGENYAIKVGIPTSERWHAFYAWGVYGVWGLSYRRASGLSVSVGAGPCATNLEEKLLYSASNYERKNDRTMRLLEASVEPRIVLLVDTDESLLFSVSQTGVERPNVEINFRPGSLGDSRIGAYIGYSGGLGFSVGLTYGAWPVGIARRVVR